jgi:predicted naringenin-chalcone synthase
MYAPGIDIQLVETLQLNRNVERTCINFMGCYAAINALKTAYHIARSQPEAVIMLAGVELCTLHYQKNSDPNQVIANALFADGAAVAIVSAKDLDATSAHNYILKDFYAEFEQSAANEMVWRIGDSGFDLRLTPEVPNVVKENIEPLLQKLFAKTGLTKNDIAYYAIHPGGMKILEACEQALNISKQQNAVSYKILNDFGNMSSVTILFVLKEYLKEINSTDTGKNMLACAFGPGITMESMILQIA